MTKIYKISLSNSYIDGWSELSGFYETDGLYCWIWPNFRLENSRHYTRDVR